jgi:hypothetical protein
MKKILHLLPVLALALCLNHSARAQAPAGAPAGATGQCNDGSYSTASMKIGACHGHKGVKTWFTAAAKPAAAARPAATPAPAPAPVARPTYTPVTKTTAVAAAAPGGGPGMVWVNTSTKVYHCPGDRYYGKTKAGSYMTESAAKSAGFKADANKPCSK